VIDERLRRRYSEGRRKHGMRAADALRYARHPTYPPTEWLDHADRKEHEVDGFRVVVEVRPSEFDDDLSFLGEFTDKWEPGAHDRFQGQEPHWWSSLHGEYRYIVPTMTYEEHRKGLLDLKYGKAEADRLARSYVQRDIRRLEDYGNGWCMVGVVATVSLNGIELGGASVWGVESDSATEHFEELADEMVAEALEDARDNLDGLCRARRAS
jgi:hypothetical protein